MTLDVEGVIDGGVDRHKPLGCSWRLAPLLFSFPAPYRLVRVFSAIIRRQFLIIDRAPQPMFPATDLDDHLVHMPASTGVRPTVAKNTRDQPGELQKPAAYRLVRDVDATLSQQILDITKRQREPDYWVAETATMTEDLARVDERLEIERR